MSDKLKKLTGKFGYEDVVKNLVNTPDIELFRELTEQDGFLFDFIKQNVAKRIFDAVDENNYKNLLEFFKYYSPSYEDAIISNLAEFADEDLTDIILEKFENGNDNEKTYCAKYFAYIKDPLAYDFLIKNAYSENEYLAQNCASTLSLWNDEKSYNDALSKLSCTDEFEKLSAVKFLCAYGKKDAVPYILQALRTSAMAENISGEIPYLINLQELLDKFYEDGLFTINCIINGLGEILPLSVVFDFELYDIFERLTSDTLNSKSAVVLLNSLEKFETLTENDEYLFDEDKDTKNEIHDIKKILKRVDIKELKCLINYEISVNSPFVYTALEFTEDVLTVKELLKSDNQTIILKASEILKKLGNFDETARVVALSKVTDLNIKEIIRAL
ncbi:hypothetical protein J6P92_08390 [bacterium]|nr:hypothetical protein [bacterium]